MATGDAGDFLGRLRRYLPRNWFPDTAPILDGLLSGYATAAAFVYSLISYARLQTRIATATDGFLDLIAWDFFGQRFLRKPGEPDTGFRTRILPEVLRRRATRPAMVQALTDLTGRAPIIFETERTADSGGYDTGGVGYDTAGGYTDHALTSQSFLTAFRPTGAGIPFAAGYDTGAGGYDAGGLEWTDAGMVAGGVTDTDIYAAIEAVKPVGTLVWARIQS